MDARKCPLCGTQMQKDDPATPPQGEFLMPANVCRACNDEGVPIHCTQCKKATMRMAPQDLLGSGYKVRKGDTLHADGCVKCHPERDKYVIMEHEEWLASLEKGTN